MGESILQGFSGRRILEQTPDTLDALLATTTQEDRDWQPNPERWSVSMVLAHLADVEVNAFGKRFRAMGHIRQISELLRARVFYPRIGAFQKYFTVTP